MKSLIGSSTRLNMGLRSEYNKIFDEFGLVVPEPHSDIELELDMALEWLQSVNSRLRSKSTLTTAENAKLDEVRQEVNRIINREELNRES